MDPIFYFDFGSPNAYLAHRVIPGIEQRTGKRFKYQPVLLGGLFKLTGNQAPSQAFAHVPKKLAYERLEMMRFVKTHGLTKFQRNPHFPVNTLALMRCAVAAEAEGLLPAYVEGMFHFMWEEPRKLDDMSILAQTIADAGLPSQQLMQRAQDQSIKDQLLQYTQSAFDRGAFGIPSFLVGSELFFGKERLGQVEAEILSAATTS